ncbi:hypothetical protein GN244_ATG17715 [Phytophthora infestans]|uniref:Uncharacterized protein n=1 Tax=Phytophthora infestans TaxID=4787 RepID=A0A833SGQ5_PHYIN|nr:hypothetical protein GN244_ATG17715 [Phytophthora infestans]
MHHSHAMRGLQMDMSGMDMTSSSIIDMSMAMEVSSSFAATTTITSDEDFKCPYHGQTIYTCGMAARSFDDYSFDVTDTAYLAANVAEFIINSTDSTAYAKCEDSCEECASGIKDPVTGDDVTTSNYQYVCLKNGQKIYFASTDSKNEYLNSVNSEPRYLVDSIICENETCSDAENITVVSAAAQAFVPDLSASSSGGSSTAASGSSAAVSVNTPASVAFAVASVLATLAMMA